MHLGADVLIPAGQTVLVAGLIWRVMRQAAQIATLDERLAKQAEEIEELTKSEYKTQLALLAAEVHHIQAEIGKDHNSGIRGRLHKLPSILSQMQEQISELQRKTRG